MMVSSINPQDVIFSLDIGTRSVIATAGIIRDKKFHVVAESYLEHKERAMVDGQIHDINLVAETVCTVKKDLERKLNLKLKNVAIAAAGRFLRTALSKSRITIDYDKEIDKDIIRSLELTAVKQAEDRVENETSGKLYCVGYSVKNYYLNGFIISNPLFHKGENIEVEIIATFLPRYVVESLYSVMDKVGLNVISLTLEPIAAMEAAVPNNLRMLNLALVDVGAGTSDIAISSRETISAYGMVSLAGDEVTEAIAHNYLVDFNTAESMKKECADNKTIKFIDIMGLENEVSYEEMMNVIEPVVDKITCEISSKIIELNGNKAPNAVFLVGGGAHTPGLKEKLADKLNISIKRVGIKGREAIPDCVCPDSCFGSEGVTVLGIALVSIKQLGHDFIDVVLNGNVISMFNSHRHTVMDVMLQGGINPKLLIGKNGKNVKFELNGIKRIAFGTLAKNAEVAINDTKKSIDSDVKEGDIINIEFASDGKDAEPKVMDFIQELFSLSFYINDHIESMEPRALLGGRIIPIDYYIHEGDSIQIIYPETLMDYKKYFSKDEREYVYRFEGSILEEDYIIKEGDRIYRREKQLEAMPSEENTEGVEESAAVTSLSVVDKTEEVVYCEIKVTVNDNYVILKNKSKYIFVDVFNYVEFDLSRPRGNLKLLLNDKSVGYYDPLSNGDHIKIFWEKD
jgi:cell division protein FtsA